MSDQKGQKDHFQAADAFGIDCAD